jgi:hypothetical protein
VMAGQRRAIHQRVPARRAAAFGYTPDRFPEQRAEQKFVKAGRYVRALNGSKLIRNASRVPRCAAPAFTITSRR